MLIKYESCQLRAVHEIPLYANLLESGQSLGDSVHGGYPPFGGCKRRFRSRTQCQICRCFGHVAQRYYYRYNRHYDGLPPVDRMFNRADCSGQSMVSGLFIGFSAQLSSLGFPSMVPQGRSNGEPHWFFYAPYTSNVYNRVSNPFINCDDKTGWVVGPHGG